MGLTRFGVEVVFVAAAGDLHLRRLELEPGATVGQAIRVAGLQWVLDDGIATRVGVFGRLAAPTDLACEGDRIEIYRELLADPKVSRRRRAAQRIKGAVSPG